MLMIPLALAAAVLALSPPHLSFCQGSLGPASAPPPAKRSAAAAVIYSAVIQYEGTVDLQRSGGLTLEPVRSAPLAIKAGDRLRTGDGGKARLLLRDLSEARVGPNAIFVVEEETPTAMVLNLLRGKLWAQARKDKDRSFQVTTPVAVASVRGTEFSVEFDGRQCLVEVRSGLVAVQALRDGAPQGPERLLHAGERVRAVAGRVGEPETIVGGLPAGDGAMPLPAKAHGGLGAELSGIGPAGGPASPPAGIAAPDNPAASVMQSLQQAPSSSASPAQITPPNTEPVALPKLPR